MKFTHSITGCFLYTCDFFYINSIYVYGLTPARNNGMHAFPVTSSPAHKSTNPAGNRQIWLDCTPPSPPIVLIWCSQMFTFLGHWRMHCMGEVLKVTTAWFVQWGHGYVNRKRAYALSPFVTLLSRRAQSFRWSSFGKRVWFTESHIVLIFLLVLFTQFNIK